MENKDSIEEDSDDFDAMSAMMAGQETELEILEEFDQLPTDSNTNLIIKNNLADENCVKCNKKLCNGLRCTNCKKGMALEMCWYDQGYREGSCDKRKRLGVSTLS